VLFRFAQRRAAAPGARRIERSARCAQRRHYRPGRHGSSPPVTVTATPAAAFFRQAVFLLPVFAFGFRHGCPAATSATP